MPLVSDIARDDRRVRQNAMNSIVMNIPSIERVSEQFQHNIGYAVPYY